MSQNPIDDHITTIQILSLLPDRTIGSWFSAERVALHSSLASMRKHSDCVGVYWMRQIENPSKIVVISKWRKDVDEITSSSYISSLLSYLKFPPQNIHLRNTFFGFARYTTTNLITFYFPTSKCSDIFQRRIRERVADFWATVSPSYLNPDNLVHVGSAWIEETQKANGRDSKGFIICLNWNGKEAERRFKMENIEWRDLMDDIRRMGVIREQECHGEVMKIARENGDRDECIELVDGEPQDREPPTWMVQVLSGLKDKQRCKQGPVTACSSKNLRAKETSVAMKRDGEDVFDPATTTEFRFPVVMIERAKFDTTQFEDDTPESSPLLTPSSSCASLDLLYNNVGLQNKQRSESFNSEEELIFRMDKEADNCRNFCQINMALSAGEKELSCNHRAESQCQEAQDEGDLGLAAPTTTNFSCTSISSPKTRSKPPPRTIQTPKEDNPMSGQESIHRYGMARWDPNMELEGAKSRFKKYGKRVPALRLQGYITGPVHPYQESFASSAEKDIVECVKTLPSPSPWGTFFQKLLVKKPAPKLASTDDKYLPHGKIFDELVEEVNERCYRMPGSFRGTVIEEAPKLPNDVCSHVRMD